jgi:MFS family permease
MSRLLEKIDHQIATFLSTLKRFPLASFSALLITIIFVILSEYSSIHDNPDFVFASKIVFVSSLGLVLFPALQLFGRSIIFPLLGLAGLIAYFYFLPTNLEDANQSIFTRHILIFIALFFMILWAPFIGRKSTNSLFWQYAQTIIFGLIASLFFSFLLYVGIAIALYAIEILFHVTIESKRYLQLSIIIFGIFGFNFFLSQIPKHPLFLETRAYSNAKRVFTKYILAPLTILYFVILFIYSAKILITFSWPEGTLSWIIVAFCMVAITTFLFLTPYLQKSTKTQRLIWVAILLQTIMLALALWVRVEAYGISYNRYLLGLFGAWVLLMSLYFILFGKWAQQKWLFFTASLFIFASQFGPYSAHAITQKDQTQRLIKLIETAHPRSEELDIQKKYDISNAMYYINEYYGEEVFEKIIPHIYKKYQDSNKTQSFPHYATQALGFKYINEWDWQRMQRDGVEKYPSYTFYQEDKHDTYLKVQGYDWLIDFYYYNKRQEEKLYDGEHNMTISFHNNHFKIEINQENNESMTLIQPSYYAKQLVDNEKNQQRLSSERLTFIYEDEKVKFKVNFSNISIQENGTIKDFDAKILFSIKEP